MIQAFNEWRKELNTSTLLPRNICLLQPSDHFFDRISDRSLNLERAKKVFKIGLMAYSKRITETTVTKLPFTLVAGDIAIPIIAEIAGRAVGQVENGKPTFLISVPTIYSINRKHAKTFDKPLMVLAKLTKVCTFLVIVI